CDSWHSRRRAFSAFASLAASFGSSSGSLTILFRVTSSFIAHLIPARICFLVSDAVVRMLAQGFDVSTNRLRVVVRDIKEVRDIKGVVGVDDTDLVLASSRYCPVHNPRESSKVVAAI